MNDDLSESDDLNLRARELVLQYSESGVYGMNLGEMRLVLSEKMLHLGRIGERLAKGEEIHVNMTLKRVLELDVKDIGKEMEFQRMLDEKSRGWVEREPDRGMGR